MAIDVCLTVDTEFRMGRTLRDPGRFRPIGRQAVMGEIESRSHGLGFILDLLARHRLSATFFVEALNVHYFGDEPMRDVAHQLLDAGQDVQLHLHPSWLVFADPSWRTTPPARRPKLSCAGRDVEDATALLAAGLEIFDRWRLPRPVALRTGNLHCDLNVYRAMARLRLPVASNIGLAVYRPAEPELRLRGGRHLLEGVMELPVLTYEVAGWHLPRMPHLLSVTGASWAETRSLLGAAAAAGVSPVVILTHPFEYVKERGHEADFRRLRPNRVNQRRLRRLCDFLDRHRAAFRAVTFSASADRWLAAGPTADPVLTVSPARAACRIVENLVNDRVPLY